MAIEKIYVKLIDEPSPVWRPVAALKFETNFFVILMPNLYSELDEEWEFKPGQIVECDFIDSIEGSYLRATRAVEIDTIEARIGFR